MGKIGTIHWKKFEKVLLALGCKFVRERGDHRIYHKTGLVRPVIVPRSTTLPSFIVLNNLRTLGVSREEYQKILKKL